jgi:hypothetical protein
MTPERQQAAGPVQSEQPVAMASAWQTARIVSGGTEPT